MKKLKAAFAAGLFLCAAISAGCRPAGAPAASALGPAEAAAMEPTGELVVYVPNNEFYRRTYERTLGRYKTRFPAVEVRYEYLSSGPDTGGAYTERVSVELMAGEGPDVFHLGNGGYQCDLFKIMQDGLLLNLNAVFEGGAPLEEGNFILPVFSAGAYRGGRYFLPLYYDAGFVFSSEENLAALGLGPARPLNVQELFEKLGAALPAVLQTPGFHTLIRGETFSRTMAATGIPLIDPEKAEALPAPDELGAFLRAYQPYYAAKRELLQKNDPAALNPMTIPSYLARGTVLMDTALTGTAAVADIAVLRAEGAAPVFLPLRGVGGQTHATADNGAAVSAAAKNVRNAVDFIKTMAEDEVQAAQETPVTRSGFDLFWQDYKDEDTLPAARGLHAGARTTVEDALAVMEVVRDIDAGLVRNDTLNAILEECMTPFLNGEQSYGSCEARLRERLEIYLSE